MKKLFFFLSIAALFAACSNLEKEIDINLPNYNPQLVVECYLEPGKPFRMLLTNSSGYFDEIPTDPLAYFAGLLEDSAQVTISCNGIDYPLSNNIGFTPGSNKIFNYSSAEIVPADFDHDFSLNIITKEGKTITSTTRILPIVPIDSLKIEFDETDTLARVVTYLTDDQTTQDYYRRMLNVGSLDSVGQDFTTDDLLFDTPTIAFGTGYNFGIGDTLYNTITHIDKAYFDYLLSVNLAVAGNGNPFSQPTPIKSNVTGTANALGIFTGLSYVRDTTIIHH